MKISNQWSALPNKKPQAKDRVFETDKGYLIVCITDETDDNVVAKFKHLISLCADVYDKCQNQNEVYSLKKHTDKLLKTAGVIDS